MEQHKDSSIHFLWISLFALLIFLFDQIGLLLWYKNIHSFISVPIEYSLSSFKQNLSNSFISLQYAATLKKENDELKMKILELEKISSDQAQLLEAKNEIDSIKQVLSQLSYKKVLVATILDATVNDIAGYLQINKGSNDGITLGSPVVVKDYYLGYVDTLTSHSATVKSIEVSGQAFIGYVENRKISATVKTEIGKIILDDILANETIQLHDLVAIKRENLPYLFSVGTITTTPKDTGTAERVGIITPFARTSDISFVTVILE